MQYTKTLLNQGLKKFNQKKIDEAKTIFKRILDIDQNNLEANHALGVCYGSTNDHVNAKNYFEKAINIKNNYLPSQLNLAISNYELGDFKVALNIYINLIRENPSNFQFNLNAGNCYFKLSDYENATFHLNKAIELDSKQFMPFLLLGIIKISEKNFDESLNYLLTAEQLDKNQLSIFYQIADAFYKKNNFEKSIDYLDKCLNLKSDYVDAIGKKGLAQFEMGKNSDGEETFKILLSLSLNPKIEEFYLQKAVGVILRVNDYDTDKDYSLVFKFGNLALAINPNNYAVISSMGIAKYAIGDLSGALADVEKAKEIKPNSSHTLQNLGNLYKHIGKFKEAESTCEEFFKIFPNDESLDFLYATSCLSQNKFKNGWRYYESRWSKDRGAPRDKPKPQFEKPLWSPKLGYNSILVWAEQGLGDQILHGTILNDFSKKFNKTYLAIDPRLLQMFKESFPNITSFSLFDNINQDFFDYQIPLTSIAEYCRNSVEDFPKKVAPYLNLVESKVHNPRFSRKLKCALSWNSSLGTHSALKRIPLESFKKILQMEQIEFFNIQYNHGGDDLINEVNEVSKKYNVKLYDPGIDVKDDIRGLIDFIGDCDFVISCSNTNVHLSGAIGKKIYALLPVPAGRFWYWENNFEGKNLWYPSMDIIKQEERYSWETPIKILYEMIKNDFNL